MLIVAVCFGEQMGIRVMDSNDQERERGITILAKVREYLQYFQKLEDSWEPHLPVDE